MLRHDDKGRLEAILSINHENQVIVLDFLKPVTWACLQLAEAEAFHAALGQKIEALRQAIQATMPGPKTDRGRDT